LTDRGKYMSAHIVLSHGLFYYNLLIINKLKKLIFFKWLNLKNNLQNSEKSVIILI
jgi:hypothetical protein